MRYNLCVCTQNTSKSSHHSSTQLKFLSTWEFNEKHNTLEFSNFHNLLFSVARKPKLQPLFTAGMRNVQGKAMENLSLCRVVRVNGGVETELHTFWTSQTRVSVQSHVQTALSLGKNSQYTTNGKLDEGESRFLTSVNGKNSWPFVNRSTIHRPSRSQTIHYNDNQRGS